MNNDRDGQTPYLKGDGGKQGGAFGILQPGALCVPKGQNVVNTFIDDHYSHSLIVHCTQSVFRINLETNEVVQLL